jgi:predicted nucleotidyltransferase
MFNVLDMSTGWKIDLIFKKPVPFHEGAFLRRKAVTFEGVHTSMISLEDLILSKLEWSKMGESERQVKDAAIVLQKRLGELDQNYIQKWIKELGLSSQWNLARKLAGLE